MFLPLTQFHCAGISAEALNVVICSPAFQLNYKAKHESEKFKCSIPPDAPLFLQSRVNAYNISDTCYKYDWETLKDKKFEIKFDAIPILAAKANQKNASDVEYKKAYEQSRGKLVGALSIEDDPKLLHSQKVAKLQSDVSTHSVHATPVSTDRRISAEYQILHPFI
nr:nebulin-like [Zootoca vivipara]